MTTQAQQLLERFPIRKSKAQKAAFRDWLCQTLRESGYETRTEESKAPIHSANVVVGDLDKAEMVIGAHYDTCAVLPVPNFITPRNPVAFLVYQLLMTVLIIAPAIGAEVLVLVLFEPPMWVAMAVVYAVLIFIIWWVLAGKANKSNVNDNTSGVITLLEVALTLPEEQRDKLALVFFDNEEKGLFGSSAFYRKHKAVMKDKLLLNFDCVSDGDHIMFFPSKALKKDNDTLTRLEQAFPSAGKKRVEIPTRGFAVYPSDQKKFPKGVGIAALNRAKIIGYYLGRIHTGRDTVLDGANIELLRRGVLALVEGHGRSPQK